MNLSNFNPLTTRGKLFRVSGLACLSVFMMCGSFLTSISRAQSPVRSANVCSNISRFSFKNDLNLSRPGFIGSIRSQSSRDSFASMLIGRSTLVSNPPFLAAAHSTAGGDRGISVEVEPPCTFSIICDQGDAIFGKSQGFFGVHGVSNFSDGVFGESSSGFGVRGFSTNNNGVVGESAVSFGVVGIHIGSGNAGTLGTATSRVGGSGSSFGVSGSSTGGVGVQGRNNNTGNFGQLGTGTQGVFGTGKGSGIGVDGFSDSGAGAQGRNGNTGNLGQLGTSAFGVFGSSSAGAGVSGTSTSGFGVDGFSTSSIGVTGGSSSGTGVSGTSSNGTGVIGRNTSSNNRGELGTSSYGVIGSHGSGNAGWLGGSFFGAYGIGSTYGVYGYSFSGNGVYGISYSGVAGYFSGNAQVTGNLSKGGGSFKIDHPLDPENKYLYHSFVESPDMKNIYDGVVKLNEDGEALVEMPEWFEALNSDFRYLLTAIGAPGPGLYVAEEIKENRFKISGGVPGMKVSWQVTGIRQDAYAKKNRIPVEEEKPEIERGFYLHPDAFEKKEEKNIEWARNPEMMKQIRKERGQQPPPKQ